MSDSSLSPAAQRWLQRLERFDTSSNSVVAFCAAERVSESNFYLWKRRLALHRTPVAPPPQVVPIRFATSPGSTTPIEVLLPSGIILRLPVDISPDRLAHILTALEQRSC